MLRAEALLLELGAFGTVSIGKHTAGTELGPLRASRFESIGCPFAGQAIVQKLARNVLRAPIFDCACQEVASRSSTTAASPSAFTLTRWASHRCRRDRRSNCCSQQKASDCPISRSEAPRQSAWARSWILKLCPSRLGSLVLYSGFGGGRSRPVARARVWSVRWIVCKSSKPSGAPGR